MNKLKYLFTIIPLGIFFSCGADHKNKDHQDHTDSTGNAAYNMLFSIDPANPSEGLATKFTLRPVKTGTDSTVALDIQHEKKIHLIVVSEDLSSFRHLHPVEQTDGSYILTDTFPHGGNYILYADYMPVGAIKQVNKKILTVNGREGKPVVYEKQVLQCKTNGYTVEIKPADTNIASNKEVMLTATVNDAKRQQLTPDQLENYLGEKAHMVIIGISNKKYLHVHPMIMGSELMLHTTFPEAGLYRAWFEFKKEGKVNLADFVIKVH
jgi:hypothetical protein